MLNSSFNKFSSEREKAEVDLYPEEDREKIDSVIKWVNELGSKLVE